MIDNVRVGLECVIVDEFEAVLVSVTIDRVRETVGVSDSEGVGENVADSVTEGVTVRDGSDDGDIDTDNWRVGDGVGDTDEEEVGTFEFDAVVVREGDAVGESVGECDAVVEGVPAVQEFDSVAVTSLEKVLVKFKE